jgi:chemotaxis protein CheC
MSTEKVNWSTLVGHRDAERMFNTAIWRAAGGLSTMIGRAIDGDNPRVTTIPIGQRKQRVNGDSRVMIGVYQLLEGSLRGHAMLLLSKESAMNLVDLLMENPVGTTRALGELEQSALAEACNIATSHFLNTVAKLTSANDILRPSKPTVLEGKLDTILDIVLAPASVVRKDLTVIGTTFNDLRGTVQAHLLVFPDPAPSNLIA